MTDNKVLQALNDIQRLSMTRNDGTGRAIYNHASKIIMHMKKRTPPSPDALAEQRQIADRYIAKKAIFEALKAGRTISFLDSAEFEVSEMHTQMHCIREDIRTKQLPYILEDKWMTFGLHGKRCKAYSLRTIEQ